MRGPYVRTICVLLLLLLSLPVYSLEYVPGEVIVKMKPSSGQQNSIQNFISKVSTDRKMELKQAFKDMNMYHYKIDDQDSVHNAISDLEMDPDVEFVEPNYIVRKATVFDNQLQSMTPEEVALMKATALSTQTSDIGLPITPSGRQNLGEQGENSVSSKVTALSFVPVVAVVDTGLDINHDVFVDSGAIWTNSAEIPSNGIDDDGNGYIDDVNGWNFVSKNGNMLDDEGHGTHVSGTVLSAGMDIFTTPYEASPMKIMPLKFLDHTGSGKTSDAISAIYYAVNNGAHIINNSWGGAGYSASLHEAIAYSYFNEVSFTAAAGNSGSNNDSSPMYPASYDVPHLMAVAATTSLDDLASFSNYGYASVDLGSPGVFILSTIPCSGGTCGHGTSSGTSMATPFVSGIAAMMLIEAPTMLPYQIKEIIFGESDYIADLDNLINTESRINGTASVTNASTASIDATQPDYTFTPLRTLASSSSGGGCGLVKNMYQQQQPKAGGGNGGAKSTKIPWSVFMILGLFGLPFAIAQFMKKKSVSTQVNRRKHERFKMESTVSMEIGGKKVNGHVNCISQGGVRMNTQELLEKGGVIKMVISSPDGSEQIEVSGQIVWESDKQSYGVQFKNVADEVSDQIENWTKDLSPEPYK